MISVYILPSLSTGGFYVGSTTDLSRRRTDVRRVYFETGDRGCDILGALGGLHVTLDTS
jgi:hypothetical protein